MADSYLEALRPTFPHKTVAELELMLASSRQLQKLSGLSGFEHRRRGMSALFPSRVWHEWRNERIESVQFCLENRIQELMWIGSSNSNKSADMADTALSLWWTKPEMTSIYVASPYEEATETGVWSYILEQFDEAKDNNPSLPGRKKISANAIVHYDKNPRSFIRVATVDQVGKLVGKKARDFSQGLLVIILDELPAFTPSAARSLMRVLPNLLSVPNLLILGAGNFANTWDALGKLCDPDEIDIPGGYSQFDPDRHFRWRTKRSGLCLRFDGLQSPNVKAGRDIYPFVTTLAYIAKLAGQPGGLLSPDAMRFIRSAPVTSLDEFTVMNGERLRAGGAYDNFEWTADPITPGAFIDPGFGGDPCVCQKFKLGYQKLPDGRRQILAIWDAPHYIPVRIGEKDAAGKDVTVETQIVRGAREHCEANRIPAANIGFDGSMRAGIVQEFAKWSLQIHAVDSNGPATERPVNAAEKHDAKDGAPAKSVTWREKVDRLLSEFWFAAASLIDSFQLKGLALSPKAVQQLTTRRWSWVGTKKRKVETKPEYKEGLKEAAQVAESPNEADALVGCVEMARRLGLSLDGVAPAGGSLAMILQMIKEREARRTIQALSKGTGLPPGRLHAMKRPTAMSSGRLNRS
jgi:hypothetical protein